MHIRRDTIENILLIFMLAFAPLALASVHTWAFCTLAFIALIIFNVHFLPEPGRLGYVIRRPESIGALVFLIVSLIYVTPLPPALVKALSPNTWDLWRNYTIDPPKLMTLSVYAHATSLYILKFVTYFMVFLVVVAKLSVQRNSQSAKSIAHSGGPALSALRSADPSPDELTSSQAHELLRHAPRPMPHAYLMLGALCAVLSILFHSLSDFNLHIPANALYFTVMLAIVTGLSQSVQRTAGSGQRTEILNAERRTLNAVLPHTASGIRNPGSEINVVFLRMLVNSLIIIAFSIALFGIIQKLSYNGKIYWLIEKDGGHFGPYVNLDHFAGYMEMCVFLAISTFIAGISDSLLSGVKRWKDRVVWFSTKKANKILMCLFFAVVMATALFMTTSRGGIMSFLVALAVLFFTSLICAEKKKKKKILLALALAAMLIVIMFSWVGPEETIDKFRALQTAIKTFIEEDAILSEIRPHIWGDTVRLARHFPNVGSGLGTYSYVFPMYRTFPDYRGFLQFAHNDYLQLMTEMGVVGGLFLCGFFVWYIRKFRQCVRGLREDA